MILARIDWNADKHSMYCSD